MKCRGDAGYGKTLTNITIRVLMTQCANLHVREVQLDRRKLAWEGAQQQARRHDHHAHCGDDVQGTLPAMWQASFAFGADTRRLNGLADMTEHAFH